MSELGAGIRVDDAAGIAAAVRALVAEEIRALPPVGTAAAALAPLLS